MKRAIEGMEGEFHRQEFELSGVETKLVVVKDEEFDWTFLSSMHLKLGGYVRLYRKRWNIETGFWVQDEARIKSKSVRPQVRYFLFLVGMLLYNCRKILELEQSFKLFLIRLNECGGESDVWKPGEGGAREKCRIYSASRLSGKGTSSLCRRDFPLIELLLVFVWLGSARKSARNWIKVLHLRRY